MTPEQTEARRKALRRAGMVAFGVVGFVLFALLLRAGWPDVIFRHRYIDPAYVDPDPVPWP